MKISTRYIITSLCILFASLSWSTPDNLRNSPTAILSNITGNIWVEIDANSTYNGEIGPSGVLVLLYDNEEDTIVAQSISVAGKYEFNGINAGKYYLTIDNSAFVLGGPLSGQQSCIGINDADNMVDDDDNGSDSTPNDVRCTAFNLSNSDPMNDVSIEYIDFCFNRVCEDQNGIAKPSCAEISTLDIICDINALSGFCTPMPTDSSAGIQPTPLCDGVSTSKNISWFAFVAGEGNYSISIDAFDCQMNGGLGAQGVQVGLYTDCTFSESVFCSVICSIEPIHIGSSLLNPGQVYYMYINGCNGNVCSYTIGINGTSTIPSLEPDDVCIFSNGAYQCTDISFCPNENVLFQSQGVDILGEYAWKITTISGGPFTGDASPVTANNILTLNIAQDGEYEVCLTEILNGCEDQMWQGLVCRSVTINSAIMAPMDEDFGEFSICENEIDAFTVNAFGSEDPNGDGDPGWNAPLPEYVLGMISGTASIEGCSYEQQFTLSSFPLTPVEDVLISVCEEDLPVQIDALTFNVFTFSGQQTFSLDNYLLQNSQDQNGCDSIINLTVEKLNILLGFIEEPICTTDGINLQFNYISDLSTDVSFLDFEWTGPAGNILPFGADPTSVLAPFASGNGEYSLSITINKNGASCNYMYSTFVDIAIFLPPSPMISGPSIVCDGENTSVYTAEGDGDETMFIWSFPNDVTSAVISGTKSESITINWTGSNGGQIVAVAQNTCGQSDQSSFNVQVIPKSTPNFSLDTSICIGNTANIDFIGSNFNLVDYTWDFDGASIISGAGMGPYEVSWNTPGEKFISLMTTDVNGCLSNTTEKSIPVQIPLTPTEVMCIPSIGEVVFTWEIPLMVSGFEVNVLSGQTGGVFTATSFTVSGLDEGEEVIIELLTKPEDPICGQFVSTNISCTASDCMPPTIELEADQSVCVDGDNITIDVAIVSGETGNGIFTGLGIIDATNGIFNPSLANIGFNTVLYTFTSDIADCVGTKTISIEVFDLPVSSYIQDQDTMCVTDILSLDYTGTPNADDFNWDFDDGEGSGLITAQNVIFSSAGLKTISLEVIKDGCVSNTFTSTVLVESENEEVFVQCDTLSYDFVTFTWNNVAGVMLYEIQIDNKPTFFTFNTSVIVDELEESQAVTITVTALSVTSCPRPIGSITCTTSKMPVSVVNEVLSNISLYPNPVQDLLFLDGIESRELSFSLYSIVGKNVKYGALGNESIDVSRIPSGIYILRIADQESRLYKDFKVVKE